MAKKIPSWIIIRDLNLKIAHLEQQLAQSQKALEESKIINGEKLHKAAIEVQHEAMYRKLAKENIKLRKTNKDLVAELVQLKYKNDINGEKEIIGTCELCNKAIYDDNDFHMDNEGVEMCDKCYQESLQEEIMPND